MWRPNNKDNMNPTKGKKTKTNNHAHIEFAVRLSMKIIMNAKTKFNKKALTNKILIIILD